MELPHMEQTLTQAPYIISEHSLISFYPLFLRPPDRALQEWRVGLEGGSLAIELPEEGVRGIQHLQERKSIAETAAALQQEFGEAIDVKDLVEELAELGFVERIDAHTFPPAELIGQWWLQAIPTGWIAWLYSRQALLVSGALILLGPFMLIFDPAVRPHARDLLWSPSYTLDLLVLLLISPLLILKHEMGHLIAARAKGLSGELTFGHRLFYLVAVSRIGGIWKLARLDRLIVYCAGMANDCMTASLCLLLVAVTAHAGLSPMSSFAALLRFLALSEYVGIVWEFQIFLKTDVYHIFADLTDRHDLPDQVAAMFRSWWHRLIRRQQGRETERYDLLTWGYAALSVIGIGGSLIWLVLYLAPATIIAERDEILLLGTSLRTVNILASLDSAVALALQILCFVLLGWSTIRTRRSKASARAN
jgi:putative peptide zinc metalloprotease protein